MTDRSSNRGRRSPRGILAEKRGAVLVFVALSLVVLIGSTGVAIDAGNGYLARVRLSRAVDAGALAAARSLRQGEDAARLEAEAVARANGIAEGGSGAIDTDVSFGVNERGENTVTVFATRNLPTIFVRLLGVEEMVVSAVAEAAAPPLDVVLVLDTSGSLSQAGAWEDLKDAAIAFTEYLSDNVDQMALVTFQLSAANRMGLQTNFKDPIADEIEDLASQGDTNIQEGLRLAHAEIMGGNARAAASKVVVFFTDGRATAVRRNFGGQDRIGAVYVNGNDWRGYFNNPGSMSADVLYYPGQNWSGGCVGSSTCFGYSENALRAMAADSGQARATKIRQDDVLIYTIGLGNFNAYPVGDIRRPDPDYLREIANENGIVSASEPRGKMYFAPTSAELNKVFREVANDLVVRLAK